LRYAPAWFLKRGLYRWVDGVFGHSLKFNGVRQILGNHFHDATPMHRALGYFSPQNNSADNQQKQGLKNECQLSEA